MPDWQKIYERSKADKVERYRKMRHDLGQKATDRQIERHAEREAKAGIERAIREHAEKGG